MIDSSLTSLGAKVVVAASSDENHPPENIIDGNTKTFWMSTGMFPQEFIIRFADSTSISAVTVDSYNVPMTSINVNNKDDRVLCVGTPENPQASGCIDTVKLLKIEKNTSPNARQFESVTEKEFEQTEGHLQSNSISLNGCSATHLRFIISTGYDHFVSVHRVSVQN